MVVAMSPEPTAVEIMMDAILNKGYTFKQFTEFTDEQLEAVYALAYRSFNSGQYEKADTLLTWLVGLDHFDNRFKIALGCVRQKKKNYKSALECFAAAAVMDLKNPVPPLRSAECFLAIGDRENAESAVRAAIDMAGDNPRHEKWRARGELILKGIESRKKKEEQRALEQ